MTRLIRLTHALEDSFLVILLTSLIGLAVMQILLRNFFDSGLSWADPLLRILVLWVGLAGAMVATRYQQHIAINFLTRLLPEHLKLVAQIFTDLFAGTTAAIIAYHGGRFVVMDFASQTFAFAEIPSWWCELIFPFAFAVISLRFFINSVQLLQKLLPGKES